MADRETQSQTASGLQALLASQAELQSLINRTPFMLVRCGRDMRYRFVSVAYARMLGLPRDEIVGKPIVEMLGESGVAALQPHIATVLRGTPVDFECELDLPQAGRRCMQIAYRPELDAAGNTEGWIASLLDVTEQKRAAAVLAGRVEELAALVRFTDRLYRAASLGELYDVALDAIIDALHCSRAAILRCDARGIMRFVAWRNLSGAYRKAVDGHSPWAHHEPNPEPVCVSDVGRADLPDTLQAVVRAEGIAALAFTPVMENGKLAGKFMSYYDSPHAFAKEEVDLALTLARQLGFALERMHAEQVRNRIANELRELNEQLEAEVERRTLERDRIWNVSEDLLAVSNFDGYFLSINPAWTRLLGWTEAEIKSMHVSELRHPEDAPQAMAGRQQLAQGTLTVRMENRFRHKDGSWRWVQWTMTENNGLIYVAGRHVTSEKEAAAALERAQRQAAHLQKMEAIGQLTGGIAHDFNNLLMIVSGHAQGLKSRLTNSKDMRALQAIQMAATRGEKLTRQLLSFSRTLPLNPAVTEVAEAVGAVRDVLQGSMQVNVEFTVDVPESTWPVCVDKSELELALVNLAVNARDAIGVRGRIAISAQNVRVDEEHALEGMTGEFVALSVTDTGCGIAADLISRVVEPFFTTKNPDKGTGLGLSQVYGFARRSGGTMQIESEIDCGTRVTIYLPRSYVPAAATSAEDSRQYAASPAQTVLIVEDNHDVREVAVSLLEQLGYDTIAVESAPEALDVLAASRPVSVVFTDVVLPGQTDGLALARAISDRAPHIPVVLTTGYSKVFDRNPEFPVLRKPYQLSDLGRVIYEALQAGNKAAPAWVQ
jgi:PAS domain S-box-containing protein